MTRTCADCGTERPASKSSLPDGEYRCHPCRRARPVRKPHSPSPQAKENKRRYRRERRQQLKAQRCTRCKAAMTPTPTGQCGGCSTRRVWLYSPPATRTTDYLSRARYHNVAYEPINKRRVYERDGWRCGICGGKVNKRLGYPHPRSASLDHIVPMRKGGEHVYANVQCAHLICNQSKRDRGGGEQLALVG